GVTEIDEKLAQLFDTTVNVANDVERTVLLFAVVPKRLTLDDGGLDGLHVEHVDGAETFLLQASHRSPQILRLVANDVRTKGAIGPGTVALQADFLRHVQDNGDW